MNQSINPNELDLSSLPSVNLEDKSNLPEISGIYFAIDSRDIVQYIGRTNNLKQRWNGHHRRYQLEELSKIKIAYLHIDGSSILLDEIEKALIDWFKPLLNNTDIVKSSENQDRLGRGGKREGAGAPKKEVKRNVCITMKVTEEFRDRLKLKVQSSGKSQNQFIIDCVERVLSMDSKRGKT